MLDFRELKLIGLSKWLGVDEIDSQCNYFVLQLIRAGIITTMSCCGHGRRDFEIHVILDTKEKKMVSELCKDIFYIELLYPASKYINSFIVGIKKCDEATLDRLLGEAQEHWDRVLGELNLDDLKGNDYVLFRDDGTIVIDPKHVH